MISLAVVIVLAGIVLAAELAELKTDVDLQLEGIRCQSGNMQESEPADIHIKGTVKRSLLQGNRFVGTILLDDGIELSLGKDGDWEFSVFSKDLYYTDLPYYYNPKTGKSEFIGTLFTLKDFSKLIIEVNGSENRWVSCPASDRAEAAELARAMLGSSGYAFE